MEWVETTGRTLEEAKEAALDQLGVDEQEAEFEIVEEARSGLFGRLRQEARVRARVQPTTPRPKVERRERRKRVARDTDVTSDPSTSTAANDVEAPASRPARRPATRGPRPAAKPEPTRGATMDEQPDLEAQGALVQGFLQGLVSAFDLAGEVTVAAVDEETLEARIDGDDLGLLIGPKGQTLTAVQELARAVIQKQGPGGARLRVDVAGYRERRREALERFTTDLATQVLETGAPTSLEPMGAADRKVVHDTVNAIDGLHTISEGEDPRRRVVILPDD